MEKISRCIFEVQKTKQTLCVMFSIILTLWWGEEVEEGIIRDRLGDRPDRATALVLLFLLDCFQRDIFALGPVNRATVVKDEVQQKAKSG